MEMSLGKFSKNQSINASWQTERERENFKTHIQTDAVMEHP